MSRRDHRFQILLDELRRQIDSSFVHGETLPSQRDLALMHGVGPTTIHRALLTLSSESCLKAVPRVGWLKVDRESAHRAGKRESIAIGIMSRRSAEEWTRSDIYPALLKEAHRRGIKIVELPNPHDYHQPLSRNRIELSKVPWKSFDVGLLVEAEDTIRLRDPVLLKRKVLAVDQDATRYGIDSVAFADAQGGAMAARALLELGHMRFAVTEELSEPGHPGDPSWTARRHGFEATISEAGGMLLPQWRMTVPRRVFHHSHHHHVRKTIAAWASAPASQRPTALFALSDGPFAFGKFFEELERHGLRIPRDLSLIAATWGGKFFGGNEPARDGMRFTCIDFDLAALVRRVFDAAVELAREKRSPGTISRRAPRLFLAPAMLAPGETLVAPA